MSTTELDTALSQAYEAGFVTDIETETLPPGLDEKVIEYISAKKNEPEFLRQWRLDAFRRWQTMKEPQLAHVRYEPIDYQGLIYYAAPKRRSETEIDPKLLETYEKLGVPVHERAALAGVAVDAVFDSVSVLTTFKDKLSEAGVIFCPISEAVQKYPELVQKYLGSVVPPGDNFFAALNSAVFSDGSFVYIPKGVRCPLELSTYFRINTARTGQFERTLIIADEAATSPTSRAAPPPCATSTSCTPRWSNSSPSKGPRFATARCRTGTPATKKGAAASTTSSPSEGCAPGAAPRSPGPRSRPARPSPGNIPA